jgi:hypothetical protein
MMKGVYSNISCLKKPKYGAVPVVPYSVLDSVQYQCAWSSSGIVKKLAGIQAAMRNRRESPKTGTRSSRQIFRDSRGVFVSTFAATRPQIGLGYRAPLLGGEPGTAQTIKVMRHLVDSALSDSSFVRLTRDVVRSVPAYDEAGELEAVFNFVSQHIRYTKDPLTKETLYPPQELLKIQAGDCDDISMLMSAMALALGYPARLITVAANDSDPNEFSHVYAEVELPVGSNNWIAMDAARPGAQFGVQPPVYFRKRAWSLIDNSYQDLNGATRMRGLGSYGPVRGLGDDVDWTAILTAGLQQIPQDIAVASGQSSALRSPYGTVSTGPYASYATPYTPGYGVPQSGYTAGASLTASPWVLPALIGLAAIFLMRGRG